MFLPEGAHPYKPTISEIKSKAESKRKVAAQKKAGRSTMNKVKTAVMGVALAGAIAEGVVHDLSDTPKLPDHKQTPERTAPAVDRVAKEKADREASAAEIASIRESLKPDNNIPTTEK